MNKYAFVVAVIGMCGLCVRGDEQLQLDKTTRPAFTRADHSGRFGIGLMAGEPSGLTMKYWLNDTLAIDAAAGGTFHNDSNFHVHSDLLLHKFDLIHVPRGQMPFYIGGGAFARFRGHHDNQVGVRVPLGVSYMFDQAPIDVFMEMAPGIALAPSARFDMTGGVGIRFWF
jgi:hypothetical protein